MKTRYTSRIWVTEEFPNDPLRCPQCNGQNLRLDGCVYRTFTAELMNGVTISSDVDQDNTTQQIDYILCHDCKVAYHLEDKDISDLKAANIILAEQANPTPKNRIN